MEIKKGKKKRKKWERHWHSSRETAPAVWAHLANKSDYHQLIYPSDREKTRSPFCRKQRYNPRAGICRCALLLSFLDIFSGHIWRVTAVNLPSPPAKNNGSLLTCQGQQGVNNPFSDALWNAKNTCYLAPCNENRDWRAPTNSEQLLVFYLLIYL